MKIKLLLIIVFSSLAISAQKHELLLENLNDFKSQVGNWEIVGDVVMDRNINVHDLIKPQTESKSKKKNRKKNNPVEVTKPIQFQSGSGILLNLNDALKNDPLETVFEHGDIELELDVMIPKGSNSGIYLQGRYEVQLKDSWGVKKPKMSDMGGIHNNWETNPDSIYRGEAPICNASKAPGLWQNIHIRFQAPRFNDFGKKVANAKFISVMLNGVLIHSNVEVPNYTGGPISKNEVAKGPIVIQGNHGPVAFRNISYQLLEESAIEMSTLNYKIYKGSFKVKGLEELNNQTIHSEGTAKLIDVNITGEEDAYGIIYNGILNIPKDDDYTITVGYTGGVHLQIDNLDVIKNNSPDAQGKLDEIVRLTEGKHSFLLTNIKSAAWRAPRLGLSIKSAGTNSKDFNTYASYPPDISSVSPIFVQPESEPRLLRGFVSFNGDGERLSHTIGIGTPEGLNFIYNLGAGNLVGMWRGDFIDATPMWHERGDGSFSPRGSVLWTFLNQPISELSDLKSAFPKTGIAPDYVSKGYIMNQIDGLPIFKYVYKDVAIENSISPDSSNTYLVQEIKFSKQGLANWYYKLASGNVKQMPDGSYAINDNQYYINILSGQTPIIRNIEGETELIISANGSSIKYEIIW